MQIAPVIFGGQGFLTVTFTPHGGLIPPVTVDALLFYCDRLYHAPDCPRWTIGDWCPFCAKFHHSYPGCWCYSGGCPKDNAAYNADGVLGFRNNRWRGFDGDLTLLDHRFTIPAPCCVCEEHLSSWYSGTPEWRLEEASGNIDAVYIDGNGDIQPLPLGTMTEALHIKGKNPSSAPNDSRVIVKATVQPVGGDEISATFTTLVTVASTRIVKNVNDDVTQSIEARLALTNGTYAVKTDREKLVPFYLISDALLDGNFHLTLGGEPGAFKVWSGDSTNSTLLLECNQTITNGNPHFFAAMDAETQVWLEVLKPGPCEIAYGFTGEGNAEGIAFTDTISITAQWELKVQVMSENNYMAGIGTGPAVNPDAVAAFNLNSVMQSVAALYSNDTRGCGITITWTNTPFTMPVVPHTYTQLDNESVLDLYRYTGDIECAETENDPTSSVITNGTMWIYKDYKLAVDNPQKFKDTYGLANMGTFIATNRNDVLYGDFIKVAFPSRTGIRQEDGRYLTTSRNHAEAFYSGKNVLTDGVHIDIVSISEENAIEGKANYTAQTFVDVLEYCTGHEIFHLIAKGYHGLPPVPPPPPNQEGPLGWPFRPLDKITIAPEELLQVDLPNRASVIK